MHDVERELTEEELDHALAGLHAGVTTGADAAARARAALMAAVQEPPARGRGPRDAFGAGPVRWLAAAAVVALLVTGGLVAQSGWPGSRGASAEATELLDRSAAAIAVAGDEPVGPGRYRRIETHAWYSVGVGREDGTLDQFLVEQRNTTWVPADPDDEWQQTSTLTGALRWLTEERPDVAARHGYGTPRTEVQKAARGEFHGPVDPADGWAAGSPAYLATLPHDPEGMYDRLRTDGRPWEDSALVPRAAELLRTGLLPAEVRAALYEALARVPGIRVLDEAADLDGRTGVAFGTTDELGFVSEIIIDPATGRFIGERNVRPDGVELASTAVTTGVADELGGEPAG